MKIYTKTGDQGETGLLGGKRVSKAHQLITVTGELDEVNSWLGLIRSQIAPAKDGELDVNPCLEKIQHELFDLGSRVSGCLTDSQRAAPFPPGRIEDLEADIDRFDGQLAPLTEFILPSGATAGCTLHLARSVCRRAERELVRLVQQLEETGEKSPLSLEQIYLNRLSDLLFVLARYVNRSLGQTETPWRSV